MIDIDDLLTGASERLGGATAALATPPVPRPSRPVGVVAAGGLAAAAAIGVAAVGVAHRDADSEGRALPPGFAEGDYGVEVVITEIDDGDGNPATRLYEADHGAGRVSTRVTDGDASFATIVAVPTTALEDEPRDTVAAGDSESVPADPQWCVEAGDGSGYCTNPGTPTPSELMVLLGSRRDGQQAVVTGLPEDAAIVTYVSGPGRYWSRPLDGVAVFPRTPAQASEARVEVIGDGGAVLDGRVEENWTPTDDEIRAAVVTEETGERIVDGWFAAAPDDVSVGYTPEIVRRTGRTSLTGYTGPFSLQGLVLGQDAEDAGDEMWFLTIPTADVDEVSQRLERATGVRLRETLERSGGLTVLVWASDEVDDARIADAIESLVQRAPLADRAVVLDAPRAWSSNDASPPIGRLGGPIEALLTEPIEMPSGAQIVAQADDVGEVRFMAPGVYAQAGSPFFDISPPLTPATVGAGLWVLPGLVTSVELTLADGSVVLPELVDARPYAEVTVMIVPDDARDIVDITVSSG